MGKYINADLLREKITEQMESVPREVGRGAGTITSVGYGMMQAFQIMRSIVDSLQSEQPEVDFEKELDRIWFDNKFGNRFDNSAVDFANVRWICKHFYERGINARKEE